MSTKWKRPQNCPREIRTKWPGITYPDEHGCQARITIAADERPSRYFSYSEFGGDAVAAHRAAMKWCMSMAKKHRKTGVEAVKLQAKHRNWLESGGAQLMAVSR